jgi:phage RecT family recombinase
MKKEPQEKNQLELEVVKEVEVAIPQPKLTPIQLFQQNLNKYETSILPDLLKKHKMDASQFKQIVLSEIKKNDKLLQAFMGNPSSLFASILAGAEIGLTPSDALGEFYLIPRNIDGKMTVTPLIGYKGMVTILLRSGDVKKIESYCVFEGDEFEVKYGLEPTISHTPNFEVKRNSKTLKFVYAFAKLLNGDTQFVVLSKEDIMGIKGMSRYDNHLYFNDAKDPQLWMPRKTALIQLAKMLPKDYYGKTAVNLDQTIEGGATLMLDEEGNVKIVDGQKNIPNKQQSLNAINYLPDLPE